jgi:hypothetical protein
VPERILDHHGVPVAHTSSVDDGLVVILGGTSSEYVVVGWGIHQDQLAVALDRYDVDILVQEPAKTFGAGSYA